jgi:hypothetical protein
MKDIFRKLKPQFPSPVTPASLLDDPAGSIARALVKESGVFPCRCDSTMVLHAHISPGGWNIGPLLTAVQRRSLNPIDMIIIKVYETSEMNGKLNWVQMNVR